jgi:UDP-N-acetylglucosamine transferase subunit ALG13
LPIKIVAQLPKILKAIRTEHRWLQMAIKKHGITAVISDNRYGMYNSTITSIIITHQLTIKAPSAFLERLIQKLSYRLLNRFNECWVPDQEGMPNLAGVLSHPRHLPAAPVKYLGALSRLRKLEHWQKLWNVLCILSGPEPQRTLLENKLLLQLRQYNGQVLLIRGLPGSTTELPGFKNVRIVNHLPASELEQHLVASEIVISRSGYTTVMDLCKLQKKAIFIPTPGQTEQEYLAQHLHKQQWCLYFTQEEFQLEVALAEAKKFTFSIPEINMDTYHLVVDEFVKSLAAATILNSTFAGK